jgi:hypothetical protein
MRKVFIIGLPKAIRGQVEAVAKTHDTLIKSVLADKGERAASLRIVPYPERAIEDLQTYADEYNNFSDALVLVLPYAKLPPNLNDELDTFESLGGTVERPRQGENGWGKFPKTQLDKSFYDSVVRSITQTLFPKTEQIPSEYYRDIASRNTQFLIAEGALQSCDEVAGHRYDFLISVADALHQYVINGGSHGRIDAYFNELGLEHAQSGGINATLQVIEKGNCVHKHTTSTHLKKGDKTTRIAAARVYYHNFIHNGRLYIAVLYAGPHPDNDIDLKIHLI